MGSASRQIAEILADRNGPAAPRAERLRRSTGWATVVARCRRPTPQRPQRSVRIEAQRLLAKLARPGAPLLSRILENGTTPEKQAAFATLGAMPANQVRHSSSGRWLDIRTPASSPPKSSSTWKKPLENASPKSRLSEAPERGTSRPKDDPTLSTARRSSAAARTEGSESSWRRPRSSASAATRSRQGEARSVPTSTGHRHPSNRAATSWNRSSFPTRRSPRDSKPCNLDDRRPGP